jgi:hypothetical protein
MEKNTKEQVIFKQFRISIRRVKTYPGQKAHGAALKTPSKRKLKPPDGAPYRGVSELSQLGGTLTFVTEFRQAVTDFVKPNW